MESDRLSSRHCVPGKGKTRAQDAAVSAINSPLLDFPIKKAKGIVFNVCGGTDLTLQEVTSFSVLFAFSFTFFFSVEFQALHSSV